MTSLRLLSAATGLGGGGDDDDDLPPGQRAAADPDAAGGADDSPAGHDDSAGGLCGCCTWFCAGPFIAWNAGCKSRWTMIAWTAIIVLSLIFYLVYLQQKADGKIISWGYIAVCLLAVLMSVFASASFRGVLALKEQVDTFRDTVSKIDHTQEHIVDDVLELGLNHGDLVKVEELWLGLHQSLDDKHNKFVQWNEGIVGANSVNINAVAQLKHGFLKNKQHLERQLERAEKSILDHTFEEMSPVTTAREYLSFVRALPPSFRQRIRKNVPQFSFENLQRISVQHKLSIEDNNNSAFSRHKTEVNAHEDHPGINRHGFREVLRNWKIEPDLPMLPPMQNPNSNSNA